MRTIVDIPEPQLKILAEICDRHALSRAEVVRQAISFYAEHHARSTVDDAFGLWKDRQGEGLSYQHALRAEWGEA